MADQELKDGGPVFDETDKTGKSKTAKTKNKKGSYGKTAWMWKRTGELVNSVSFTDLTATSAAVSSTTGFELLCTYSWTMLTSPTIYVPGKFNPSGESRQAHYPDPLYRSPSEMAATRSTCHPCQRHRNLFR